jgi:hypothetical protein
MFADNLVKHFPFSLNFAPFSEGARHGWRRLPDPVPGAPQSCNARISLSLSARPTGMQTSLPKSNPYFLSTKVYAMAGDAFPTQFPKPVKSYDAHIYFFQGNPASSDSARALRETIIEKFPHLEVYKFWEKPIGPHPTVSHPGLVRHRFTLFCSAPFSFGRLFRLLDLEMLGEAPPRFTSSGRSPSDCTPP